MRRERRTVPGLTEAQRVYFSFDCDMLDNLSANFESSEAERQCYEAHRDEIIAERIQATPCQRPSAWWRWEKGMSKPIDPLNDFYNNLAEAEKLYDLGELHPEELPALDHLRRYYGRCRAMEEDRCKALARA